MHMCSSDIQRCVPKSVQVLCQKIHEKGGQAWLVGGCVRDLCLGIKPVDWDIEVYGLDSRALQQVLQILGRCEWVGKKFGVFKLWYRGMCVDVAMPRKERKVGEGHKGFTVELCPDALPEQAVLRRDFTINAMMYDPMKNQLLDFHHGQDDLKRKCLRHISLSFAEDPLRPLRAMQFAARFGFELDHETIRLCQQLLPESRSLPASRIWQEWCKWCHSSYPSKGLSTLKNMGWLELYPELKALIGCPQHAVWHPEGDVWVHTGLVVDAMAELCRTRNVNADNHVVLMLAALCHDLGKPKTTIVAEGQDIQAPRHAEEGVEKARAFLRKIAAPKAVVRQVLPLVAEHGVHFSGIATATAVASLACRLGPANVMLWEMLTEADACGCTPLPPSRPALSWLQCAQSLGAAFSRVKPIVTGQMLLAWGMETSPRIGQVLEEAYKAQIKGEFNDLDSAYLWLKKYGVAIK